MEGLLSLLGMLFFMFLVLAAAVEVILEVFRGTLERLGIHWATGKVTLDEALKLAAEFSCGTTNLNAKLEAVKAVASQLKASASSQISALDSIKTRLQAATPSTIDALAGEINDVASKVKVELEANERQRVFLLRTVSALVGCLLVWSADFQVFRILVSAPEAGEFVKKFASLERLGDPTLNIIVGGFAAAAGSSYWHDQLDRIRNLKALVADTKKLALP